MNDHIMAFPYLVGAFAAFFVATAYQPWWLAVVTGGVAGIATTLAVGYITLTIIDIREGEVA